MGPKLLVHCNFRPHKIYVLIFVLGFFFSYIMVQEVLQGGVGGGGGDRNNHKMLIPLCKWIVYSTSTKKLEASGCLSLFLKYMKNTSHC